MEESRLQNEVETQQAASDSKIVDARRDLYLAFLKTIDVAWHLCQDPGALETAKVDAWWSEYQIEQQRMALLAAGPVAAVMDTLREPMSQLAEDLEAETKAQSGSVTEQETGRRGVWDKHALTILTMQREIELRMREDLRTPE